MSEEYSINLPVTRAGIQSVILSEDYVRSIWKNAADYGTQDEKRLAALVGLLFNACLEAERGLRESEGVSSA